MSIHQTPSGAACRWIRSLLDLPDLCPTTRPLIAFAKKILPLQDLRTFFTCVHYHKCVHLFALHAHEPGHWRILMASSMNLIVLPAGEPVGGGDLLRAHPGPAEQRSRQRQYGCAAGPPARRQHCWRNPGAPIWPLHVNCCLEIALHDSRNGLVPPRCMNKQELFWLLRIKLPCK